MSFRNNEDQLFVFDMAESGEHCQQVLPNVIWEERVATSTSDNALSHCVCYLYYVQRYETVKERYCVTELYGA